MSRKAHLKTAWLKTTQHHLLIDESVGVDPGLKGAVLNDSSELALMTSCGREFQMTVPAG